jgi:hypothetical protein
LILCRFRTPRTSCTSSRSTTYLEILLGSHRRLRFFMQILHPVQPLFHPLVFSLDS